MPGNVLAHGSDESRDAFQLFIGIVMAGDDKRGDLDPDAELLIESDRIKHRLKSGAADILVKIVRKSFEIDIRSMEIRANHIERLRRDVSIRNEHILEPCIDCQASRVVGKFEVDRRFGLSV